MSKQHETPKNQKSFNISNLMLYKLTTFLRHFSCQSDNFAMIKNKAPNNRFGLKLNYNNRKKINYLQLWQIL